MKVYKMKILLVISLLLIVSIFSSCNSKSTYIDNYYELVNLSEKGILGLSYNEIVNKIGDPISEEVIDDIHNEIFYTGYKINLTKVDDVYYFSSVTILDESIRLGKKEVGINSSIKEIESAYRKCDVLNGNFEANSIAYIDGYTNVIFTINDGRVSSINFSVTDNIY